MHKRTDLRVCPFSSNLRHLFKFRFIELFEIRKLLQRLLLEEKLSPEVTDEVSAKWSGISVYFTLCNTSSTADAVPLPLKGKAFKGAVVV